MAPVLLFAFTGIVVGLASVFTNTQVVGKIAEEGTLWYNFWYVVAEGGWTVFRQMPLLFAIGLPISLATKTNARACLETFALYMTFNYFVSAILKVFYGIDAAKQIADGVTGYSAIAGVPTIDTSLFGGILIAALVVYLHNKYFDKKLPDFLGVFQGSVFVYIIGFVVMIPCAFLTVLIWPKSSNGNWCNARIYEGFRSIRSMGLYILGKNINTYRITPLCLHTICIWSGSSS